MELWLLVRCSEVHPDKGESQTLLIFEGVKFGRYCWMVSYSWRKSRVRPVRKEKKAENTNMNRKPFGPVSVRLGTTNHWKS